MLLKLYQLFSIISLPYWRWYLKRRIQLTKEDPARYHEKLGNWQLARPEGKLIWLHSASVGELLAILPFLKAAAEKWPQVRFLVTTVTLTAANIFARQNLSNAIHQFAPIDSYCITQKFFKYWQPDLAIFTESELWPNLIINARKQCPAILLNARMSDPSYKKWQRHPSLVKHMVASFDLVLASSKLDAEKYTSFGAKNLLTFGNIKEAAPPLAYKAELLEKLQISCGNRLLWLASSTHKGEEEFILTAHKALQQQFPNLLTIIAPRHPTRGAELQELAKKFGLYSALRSADQLPQHDTQVYIADTIGELGILYRLSDIVYMGGSLIQHGGQNVMEPARLDCALVTGPHTFNFIESIAALKEADGIIEVQNQEELNATVAKLLQDAQLRQKLQTNASQVMAHKQSILDNVMQEIGKFIEV